MMRKPRSFQLGEPGLAHFYHVVSRVAGREVLFGDAEREAFMEMFFKQLAFSGLKAVAWCFMGNHFHLLLEVPDKESALAGWTEDDLIGRLEVLRDDLATRLQLAEAKMFRKNGHKEGVARIAEGVRARLFDLSAFMKELKMRMTGWYNHVHGRKGTLWEGVFKCVLVEGTHALEMVSAYIDLNPLRAGLVSDPIDYRWCGYAAAVSGDKEARKGIERAVFGPEEMRVKGTRRPSWGKTVAQYRMLLHGLGEERVEGDTVDGAMKRRGGYTPKEIREVLASRGELSLAQALRCRVRYFTDGVVLGSKDFVNGFFERKRGYFGAKRTSGARKLRGADWGKLRALRDLRVDPFG
jgi:putative transposase